MARKPDCLIYGVEDRPTPVRLILIGVQHVFLMSSTLVLPVALVREIGGSFEEIRAVVALTMIACGIGTILQALRWRGIGSGFLCPNLCGPNFFGACAEAAWLGGLPLMRGMTIVAGIAELLFARLVHRLRRLFPPEITGLVVLMVAVGLIPLGVSKFFGISFETEPIAPASLAVACLTLFVMVGINVWSKGNLRLYGVLIGMAAGYGLSVPAGLLGQAQFSAVSSAKLLALPVYAGMGQIDFRWSLLPPFLIVSICGALKTFGNLILCEKVNDADWKGPDVRRIGDGLFADGLCVAVSGLIGGMASDTSASNVALSSATGATSRWIGYAAGALFILLGFSPKLSAVLAVMPQPVMGAILVFVTSFMVLSGLQIIIGAHVDAKKAFVIGFSFIFGLSIDMLPGVYAHLPHALRPFFDSALTLSTVLAVILNRILSLGSARDSDF